MSPVLDGKRLARPWFVTPLTMTAVMAAVFYAIACFAILTGAPYYVHMTIAGALGQAGWWPLGLAAFFGLCGMGWGSHHSAGARADTARAFGVAFLQDDHALTKRVHRFAAQLNLPPPSVGLMTATNAFAVGTKPSDAAVVVGVPLAKGLEPDELNAVIGHELGHIATGDMLRMQMAEGYQRMFVTIVHTFLAIVINAVTRTRLGNMLGQLFALLARHTLFIGTELMVKRLSRRREYYADAIGALLTSPQAMIGALQKLHALPAAGAVDKRYAYLMLRGGSFGHLFATHPTVDQRVAALEAGHYIAVLRAMAGVTGDTNVEADGPVPHKSKALWKRKLARKMNHIAATPRLLVRRASYKRSAVGVINAARNSAKQAKARITGTLLRFAYPLALLLALAVGFFGTLAIL